MAKVKTNSVADLSCGAVVMEGEEKLLIDIVKLLQSVEWLHNFPVTQVFTRNVFDQMPEDWKRALSDLPLDVLNGIPQGCYQDDWPPSLRNFLEDCRRLSVHHNLSDSSAPKDRPEVQVPPELGHRMSAKKRHEMAGVVSLVGRLVEQTGCRHVLDVGSGMGYIDTCLHEILGLSVLGAEIDSRLVKSATRRQTQLSGHCHGVKHRTWALVDNEATLRMAREVIGQLVNTNHPCTCYSKGRAQSVRSDMSNGASNESKHYTNDKVQCLDSIKSTDDICKESKENTLRECMCHIKNEFHGLKNIAPVSETCNESRVNTVINVQGCSNGQRKQSDNNSNEKTLPMAKKCICQVNKQSEFDICLFPTDTGGKCKAHSSANNSNPHSPDTPHNKDSNSRNACILLGLHACADLSPIMMKMFQTCPQVSSLALLSCCYHKLEILEPDIEYDYVDINHKEEKWKRLDDVDLSFKDRGNNLAEKSKDETQKESENKVPNMKEKSPEKPKNLNHTNNAAPGFKNFPMSQTLRRTLKAHLLRVGVPGLRAGAQESGRRWLGQTSEHHAGHCRNVAYRGLLEVICKKEGLTLKKLRRRCVRKSHFGNLKEYIENVSENYEFEPESNTETDDYDNNEAKNHKSTSLTTKNHKTNKTRDQLTYALEKEYANYEHLFPLIEPLTGLQLALQPVIEALVLLDRVAYLKECGFSCVWLERVFEEELSPRSVVLMAVR